MQRYRTRTIVSFQDAPDKYYIIRKSTHAPEIVELSRSGVFFSQRSSQMTKQQVFDLLQLLCNSDAKYIFIALAKRRNSAVRKKIHDLNPFLQTVNGKFSLWTKRDETSDVKSADDAEVLLCSCSSKNVENIFSESERCLTM